jgi:acid stress-induced BolA-like protein IbaG/YrbA
MMSETDSEHFAHLHHVKRCKTCVSGLNSLFWGTNVAKHRFYSIEPKMLLGSVLERFANLRLVERWKLVFRAWCTISGTKVAKHPFYSIGYKMIFGSVSEHFSSLLHVKRWKTCISSLNALFRGTKVAKHPFYSIGTKIIFGSVSEHFAIHRHVKRWKLVFWAWMHYFRVPKLRSIHATPLDTNDIWEYYGALR